MDKVSVSSEFEVDRARYQEITGQFEKIGSPALHTIELEDLRDTFEWERDRFVKIDSYVQQGFDLHARMFESMVSVGLLCVEGDHRWTLQVYRYASGSAERPLLVARIDRGQSYRINS